MMSAILVVVGAAYDLNVAITAKAKAQSLADTIALTAAINVRALDGLPQNDDQDFVDATIYNLATIGFDIEPYVKTNNANLPRKLGAGYLRF